MTLHKNCFLLFVTAWLQIGKAAETNETNPIFLDRVLR
jgi:hypothetical protein